MQKQNKVNIIIGAGAVLIFVAAVFFMNQKIARLLESQTHKNTAKIASEAKPELVGARLAVPLLEEDPRQLIASDLSEYPIAPQRINRFTNNQRYWDTMTKSVLNGSDALESMERGGIFKGATMTPSQFQKQLQRIDGRIEEYEQIVTREPDNGYAQKKLNDLYMLKSSMDVLRPAIVGKK